MSDTAQNNEAKTFAKFLEARRVLIIDPSATARSGLFTILTNLGAKKNLVTLVNSFKQAQEQIPVVKPHVVIAEYDLGKRCGLDLLQNQREQMPKESKEMIFIVATGNTSQTAVAKAAEEDIDAYIIKPFTPETVRKTIMRAALLKIQPPPYLTTIEEGKKELEAGNLDKADELFRNATGLDPAPSLACYYLGQTKFLRNIMEQAKGSYSKGLEFNKIHYKCLVGLYELMVKQKQHGQAYEVVKRISQYFPANPKRLAEVLRLAIINAKYEDVERYYSIFCNIDDRDEMLIKYICAALVVCGRYYLANGSRSRAIELFTKASATGTGRVKILKEIVQALLDFSLPKEARIFLEKFPPATQNSEDFLLTKFQIFNAEGNNTLTIELGRELIQRGIHDENLYRIMIQCSIDAKLDRAVESLHNAAVMHFPNKRDVFDKLIGVKAAS